MCLWETALGVLNVGSFHQQSDFGMRVAGQSLCFPENHDFHVLCLNDLFLFGGQICGAFKFLEYRV